MANAYPAEFVGSHDIEHVAISSSLQGLPTELLGHIAARCNNPTLKQLAAVNRDFRDIAERELYRSIHIHGQWTAENIPGLTPPSWPNMTEDMKRIAEHIKSDTLGPFLRSVSSARDGHRRRASIREITITEIRWV